MKNFLSKRFGYLLIAAGLFVLVGYRIGDSPHASRDALQGPSTHQVGLIGPAACGTRQVQLPIETITVGTRVPARNPEVSSSERASWTEPDWHEWVKLTLDLAKADGTNLRITLLRPESWVRENLQRNSPSNPFTTDVPVESLFEQSLSGATIELDLEELGAVGHASVLSIEPPPTITPGPGRVVTATFHHASAEIIDLVIQGESGISATIGVTGEHPFWSADREAFIPARDLRNFEQLVTNEGDTKRVVNVLPRPGPQAVYNLEVHGEHVYYVGLQGLLVHNMCTRAAGVANGTNVSKQLGDNLAGSTRGGDVMRHLGLDAHHIVPWDSPRAARLRQFMLDNGFTLDEIKTGTFNGVWLPASARKGGLNKGVKELLYPPNTWHKGAPPIASKHSSPTMNEILRRISPLEGNKTGIMDEIRKIGREMQDGVFLNQ